MDLGSVPGTTENSNDGQQVLWFQANPEHWGSQQVPASQQLPLFSLRESSCGVSRVVCQSHTGVSRGRGSQERLSLTQGFKAGSMAAGRPALAMPGRSLHALVTSRGARGSLEWQDTVALVKACALLVLSPAPCHSQEKAVALRGSLPVSSEGGLSQQASVLAPAVWAPALLGHSLHVPSVPCGCQQPRRPGHHSPVL